jgi:aminocarboxymuconate-semialdehyde decarboxylase
MIGCLTCLRNRRAFLAGMAAAAASAGAGLAGAREQRMAPTAPALPVIDFHTHLLEPTLITDKLRAGMGARPELFDSLLRPERPLRRMELQGISKHVVSQAGGIQGISWGDARADLEIHRRINDTVAGSWVAAHPDRFIGAFGAPTQDLKLALPEVERMARTPGMKVMQVSSHTPDKIYYGDPSLDPLLEALEHFGIILFIHPHLQMRDAPLNQFGLENSVGQGIEEAKVMANIIYQGVFEKFPRLKILVAHGGGFLPHYPGRMDRNVTNVPGSARNLKEQPSAYLRRFYYDSCVYGSDVLVALAKAVGSDRIVLGGDYPVGTPDAPAEVSQASGLSPAQISAILAGNAPRLLTPA